jgi:HAD superfamily hydrolase (TIGR01484 family)
VRTEGTAADTPLDLAGTTAVVLDVDGTIAGADNLVSPRTRAVMREIEEQGVPVVVATGRTRSSVLELIQQTGLRTPGVSCNGAIVTDPVSGEDLRRQTMDPADVAAMLQVHEETGAAITWWTTRDVFATCEDVAAEGAAVFLDEVLRQLRQRVVP